MEMVTVFQIITLVGFFILIGALISKTFPYNDDTRRMFVSLIINVALPAIILSSIFNVEMSGEKFKLILFIFVMSIVINILGIGLGYFFAFIYKRSSTIKKELAILSGLGSTGFIGIPLCAVLFGPEGALYAAVFDAGVDFTIWTVGVLLLQTEGSFKLHTLKAMINAPMIAIFIGLTSAFFHFKPPIILIDLFDYLAALAAPIGMFYVGTILMNFQRAQIQRKIKDIWIPLLVKLIILPLTVTIIVLFINVNYIVIQTILIQSMMPTLSLASVLFAKFSADEEIGAMTTI